MALDVVLQTILQQADAGVGSLMLIDPNSYALKIVAASGFPSEVIEQVKKLRLAPGQGIAGHVYQTGKPYYLRDANQDSLFVPGGLPAGYQSQFLSLPIEDKNGKTLGVLNIHFPSKKILSAEELEELRLTASRLVCNEIGEGGSHQPLN